MKWRPKSESPDESGVYIILLEHIQTKATVVQIATYRLGSVPPRPGYMDDLWFIDADVARWHKIVAWHRLEDIPRK
jgi:hypothetical protein